MKHYSLCLTNTKYGKITNYTKRQTFQNNAYVMGAVHELSFLHMSSNMADVYFIVVLL